MEVNRIPSLGKNEVLRRVIFTARKDTSDIERYYEDDHDTWSFRNEWRLGFNDWDIEFEVGNSKEFEKVAAIVGEEKATEVLTALGR